jgi:MYXO-CTERM domain-containing protein
MRRLLLATVGAAALLLPNVGWADTILDPLHGQCDGCAEVNSNHTPMTTAADNLDFGFTASSPPQAGQLELVILVPTIVSTGTTLGGATLTELAGPAASSSLSPSFLGTFSSGFLENFMKATLPASLNPGAYASTNPNNPFGDANGGIAAGPDAVLNTTVTGFQVFAVNAGNFTIGQGPGTAITGLADQFSETGLPIGTEIVAFLNQGSSVIATAPSGQLDITQLSTDPAPGPTVASGLPGFLALALGGFLLWQRRRNKLELSLMP